MKKVQSFMHISLDGFIAGPNGEMNWIKVDEEIFDYVGDFTNRADVALYGRNTFDMMEAYWPTAADGPNPSKHAREHSKWYMNVDKVVISKTLDASKYKKVKVIGSDFSNEIGKLKAQGGKDVIIFGSPSATQALMNENLIDDYWLFINPILIGKGMQFFKNINNITNLKLAEVKQFKSGVMAVHYEVIK